VLNLVSAHKRFAATPEALLPQFFDHPLLNRCIIVKHRLRPNERDLLANGRASGTKVLLPIDPRDLRLGAQYFFMGQRDFDQVTQDAFGNALAPGHRDRQVLDIIDELPSLDPFLLREHLRRHGFEVARAYFNISDADIDRMHAYVQAEVTPLAAMSFKAETGSAVAAAKLVQKILASNAEDELAPLRAVLRLEPKAFLDGVFAWRGFLYYKWALEGLEKRLAPVIEAIGTIYPRGPRDAESSAYIGPARERIAAKARVTVKAVARMLNVYNQAYKGLTSEGDPSGFREFLMTAPQMFVSLGEQLGALQHIESYWTHRFPRGKPALVTPQELMDFLLDFEDSMAFVEDDLALGEEAA
jgi:hypothetical protein